MNGPYVPKVKMSAEDIFEKALDYRDRCRIIDDKIMGLSATDDAQYVNTLKGTKLAFLMVARAMEAVLGIPVDPDETI